MKELMLYSPIWDFTAESIIEKIKAVDDSEDLTIRLNSPGGSVFAGWGIIAAMSERKGKTIIKVDGNASSMAMYMLLFADSVESLDVSRFMIHRADGYAETEEDRELLNSVNSQLRAKMETRLSGELFKSVTGVSFDDIFAQDTRKDVWLTAKQAKQIGLVSKINRLNTADMDMFSNKLVAFAEAGKQLGIGEGVTLEQFEKALNEKLKL